MTFDESVRLFRVIDQDYDDTINRILPNFGHSIERAVAFDLVFNGYLERGGPGSTAGIYIDISKKGDFRRTCRKARPDRGSCCRHGIFQRCDEGAGPLSFPKYLPIARISWVRC